MDIEISAACGTWRFIILQFSSHTKMSFNLMYSKMFTCIFGNNNYFADLMSSVLSNTKSTKSRVPRDQGNQ